MDTLYGDECCYILQKAVIMKYSNNTSKKNCVFKWQGFNKSFKNNVFSC